MMNSDKKTINEIGKIGEEFIINHLFPIQQKNFVDVRDVSFFQNLDIDFVVSEKYNNSEMLKYIEKMVVDNKINYLRDIDFVEVKTQTDRNCGFERDFRYDICKTGLPGGMAKTRAQKVIVIYIDNNENKKITFVAQIDVFDLRAFMGKDAAEKHLTLKNSNECLNLYVPINMLLKENICKILYQL